jgi:hypothetical protein
VNSVCEKKEGTPKAGKIEKSPNLTSKRSYPYEFYSNLIDFTCFDQYPTPAVVGTGQHV